MVSVAGDRSQQQTHRLLLSVWRSRRVVDPRAGRPVTETVTTSDPPPRYRVSLVHATQTGNWRGRWPRWRAATASFFATPCRSLLESDDSLVDGDGLSSAVAATRRWAGELRPDEERDSRGVARGSAQDAGLQRAERDLHRASVRCRLVLRCAAGIRLVARRAATSSHRTRTVVLGGALSPSPTLPPISRRWHGRANGLSRASRRDGASADSRMAVVLLQLTLLTFPLKHW